VRCLKYDSDIQPPLEKVGYDKGINFVYSKVMCWVALDRAIRLADRRSFPAPHRQRWMTVRDEIYLDIQTKGWNEQAQAFKIAYENDSLDASHLVMPLVFFMAPNDPRMISTTAKIASDTNKGGLVSAGLVYRYARDLFNDGLEGVEGTFNMCTFWLIEAMSRSGQRDEARLLFDQMMTFSNHLGIFAEETSSVGSMLGNFPQVRNGPLSLSNMTVANASFERHLLI
jgi:pentatricopeptide repeat protein